VQTLSDKPPRTPAPDASGGHVSERRESAQGRRISGLASFRRHVRLLWPIPALAVVVLALATGYWVILRALVSFLFNILMIAVAIKVPINIFAMTRRVVTDTVPAYWLKSAPIVVLRWTSFVVGLLLSIAFVGYYLLIMIEAGLKAQF